MVWPLFIGAAIGGILGGMSGDDGWDWKRAFGGALLGGATGGLGAGALAPAVTTSGASAGALGGAGIAGIQSGGAALAPTYATGIASSGLGAGGMGGGALTAGTTSTAMPAGLSGLSYGMGPQALASSGAQTRFVGGVINTPLMHSYARLPNVGTVPVSYGKYGPTTKAGFAQNEALMKEATAGFDYGKLGQTITNIGEQQQADARQSGFESLPSGSPLKAMTSGEDNSIARDLDAEMRSIRDFPRKRTSPGLGEISTAARGGIATKFGIMKTPSGSLTGGEIVGPGTGTSDTIYSAIYPDVASKLGASSSPIGQGHQVQDAALSDGEFVITAKAVEGVGKNAGAPPGQEREYGSKLLDQAMNQWQRI